MSVCAAATRACVCPCEQDVCVPVCLCLREWVRASVACVCVCVRLYVSRAHSESQHPGFVPPSLGTGTGTPRALGGLALGDETWPRSGHPSPPATPAPDSGKGCAALPTLRLTFTSPGATPPRYRCWVLAACGAPVVVGGPGGVGVCVLLRILGPRNLCHPRDAHQGPLSARN